MTRSYVGPGNLQLKWKSRLASTVSILAMPEHQTRAHPSPSAAGNEPEVQAIEIRLVVLEPLGHALSSLPIAHALTNTVAPCGTSWPRILVVSSQCLGTVQSQRLLDHHLQVGQPSLDVGLGDSRFALEELPYFINRGFLASSDMAQTVSEPAAKTSCHQDYSGLLLQMFDRRKMAIN